MSDAQRAERQRRNMLTERGEDQVWQLFQGAPCVRFAAQGEDGLPVLRTLSAVVVDQRLCFHGSDFGEKLGLLERAVVASADEVVAQVPSYWIHPELACPASTYYLSAIAEGTVQRVHELERKARILNALMERFQPEGGYATISAEDKRYRKVLEELMVAELVPTRVSAKHKLGQHRTRAQIERVLEGLWQRGAPGDLRALRLVREAHPERPRPAFLRGPRETTFCVAPDAGDAEQVASLLQGQYWTQGLVQAQMVRAQLGSNAWIVARDPQGRVVASARAISDCGRFGWLLDAIVHPEVRGAGLGEALLRLLLEHPTLRALKSIGLRTRDARRLYERLGFVAFEGPHSQMVLRR
jgi:ribosomal protein S18 acetylase RimI-like enzyme/nitroimidazol reductase NimA-like FMN-containing flavoprotein (pyridoxamine 5'-phosphate oxidase superfamily)